MKELLHDDSDVEQVKVGILNSLVIIVAKCSFKSAFVAYSLKEIHPILH